MTTQLSKYICTKCHKPLSTKILTDVGKVFDELVCDDCGAKFTYMECLAQQSLLQYSDFDLIRVVNSLGGAEIISKRKRWGEVCSELALPPECGNYLRALYPPENAFQCLPDQAPGFVVEQILDKRHRASEPGRKQRVEYLVKWRGYGEANNTWENSVNMMKAYPELVHRYLLQHPEAS
eukprot:TRINITY_DN1839_c0_g1_i3.p1 TRINITY_DN1839_c0_g1~~TRINITY_DN1839_c0_g1_i3.p1  ORF type:complete len:179 (-),score=9.24 TRINITY_DN1839_c0_g1_i3:271-807(-)